MTTFRSFAKLNLHLAVEPGRRPDGYHALRTLFQTIDLADEVHLELRAQPGIELAVGQPEGRLPGGPENLAWRAAQAFLDAFPDCAAGVRIELVKRIPVGAGLGGGSANAATVLRGLCRLTGLEPEASPVAARLHDLALRLGADVPFLLLGGTAWATGRGERLEPLPDAGTGLGGRQLLLVLPPFGLPTGQVFTRFHEAAPVAAPAADPPGLAGLRAGEPVEWSELIGANDLEPAAFALQPRLGRLYTALVASGAERVRMSGSGSTLFALFADSTTAVAAAQRLPSDCGWLRVQPLGRDAWRVADAAS